MLLGEEDYFYPASTDIPVYLALNGKSSFLPPKYILIRYNLMELRFRVNESLKLVKNVSVVKTKHFNTNMSDIK